IMAWGVNETLHGDNGKGFISDHAQRFLADIDIRYVASPPFSPETKPFVERVIGTMSHELLKKLPGFCGHNVSDRQAIRARQSFSARFGARLRKTFEAKLSAAELQKKLDVWAAHVYGERPHASLAGKSPNQVAAEWRGEKRIISDQHALELLAEHAVVRTIGPQGIKIGGARFVAVELGVHVNRRAMVFPDPAGDMGIVHVFLLHDDGSREPLCKAVNADRLGHQRADMAILARQAQNRFIREQRAEMRRIKARIKPETIVDAHLALAAANAAERDSVAERVIHNTVALAAAETALIPPKIPSSVTAQDIAESEERYARYTRLLKLPHRTVSQQRWMESYEKSSEYVSQREWDRILSENSWERAAL
ncbi:MAG: hypothetical protein ACREQ4_08325, partial [Candidatus Binataceae bacterium]